MFSHPLNVSKWLLFMRIHLLWKDFTVPWIIPILSRNCKPKMLQLNSIHFWNAGGNMPLRFIFYAENKYLPHCHWQRAGGQWGSQQDEWRRKWTRCLYAGHHCRWCSCPQRPVECELTVWDMTTSEPAELVALACGCAGEELKTAVEISRQLAPHIFERTSFGWIGSSRPTTVHQAHKELFTVQLIKTGPSTPINPIVKHTTLLSGGPPPSMSWWREIDADLSCLQRHTMYTVQNTLVLYSLVHITSNKSVFIIHQLHLSPLVWWAISFILIITLGCLELWF